MTYPTELLDLRYLQQFAAYPPTAMTIVDIAELMNDVDKNGQQDPMRLVLDPWKSKIRLDCGNHRVWFMPLLGYTAARVTLLISDNVIVTPENGIHSYEAPPFVYDVSSFTSPHMVKPSTVLVDVKPMK